MRHRITVSNMKPMVPRSVFEVWWLLVHKTLPRDEARILRSTASMESADSILGKLPGQVAYVERIAKHEARFDPHAWQAESDEKISGFTFDCPLSEQVSKISERLDDLFAFAPESSWDEKIVMNTKERK